jgi:hypothetical protein
MVILQSEECNKSTPEYTAIILIMKINIDLILLLPDGWIHSSFQSRNRIYASNRSCNILSIAAPFSQDHILRRVASSTCAPSMFLPVNTR